MTNSIEKTIERTLRTALLVDGFWDRWIVHGIEREDLLAIRSSLTTLDRWLELWSGLAEEKARQAKVEMENGNRMKAEVLFRKSSLYFNLTQWIFPHPQEEKSKWYQHCLHYTYQADQLSTIETRYVHLEIEGHLLYGRVRIPRDPIGCMVIFNPIDSTKEELYSYEMDFTQNRMITISFDSPGQGQTFIQQKFKGTQNRLKNFADRLIEFPREFTSLPLYLFGTSSGAAWALYGSSRPGVERAVAVSPTDNRDKLFLPAYFDARLDACIDDYELMPHYDFPLRKPGLIYHGGKDAMVPPSFIENIEKQLPEESKLILFEEEGHCCNFKLEQIRRESIQWLMEKNYDEIHSS